MHVKHTITDSLKYNSKMADTNVG